MAAQPPPPPAYQPKKGPSALKILGIIFLLLVLVCGGCVTYLFLNARSLASGALEKVTTEMVAQSDLPQEQKDRIREDISTITTAVRNKEVGMTEVGTFIQRLFDTNFISLLVVESAEAEYEAKVQPDEVRQAETELVFMRFKRGIVEEAIPPEQVNEIINQVSTRSGEQIEMKEDLTAEELESMVEAMEEAVNEANIPSEPYEVDYADLVHDVMAEVFPELAAETEGEREEEGTDEPPATEEAPAEEVPAEEETAAPAAE